MNRTGMANRPLVAVFLSVAVAGLDSLSHRRWSGALGWLFAVTAATVLFALGGAKAVATDDVADPVAIYCRSDVVEHLSQ